MYKTVVILAAFLGLFLTDTKPSAAQTVTLSDVTNSGKLLQPGVYRIGKRRMSCGRAKTLISRKFWDYGGALPNLIILNPSKLNRLPRRLRMFVYEHECAHQRVGADEVAADCVAITKGKREGWLRRRDVQSVCNRLFKHSKGDRYHPAGPKRCRLLMQCFDGRATRTANQGGRMNKADIR